jgi:hypothetical protein
LRMVEQVQQQNQRLLDMPRSVPAPTFPVPRCPRTLLWLFSKSLGGRGEGITIRAILSPRYQWDSRPGLCGPVSCPTLLLFHLNLLKSKAIL